MKTNKTDSTRPVYLDHAATTPVDPRVAEVVMHYMTVEYGNASSRHHEYGLNAKRAVEKAREQIAAVVQSRPEEVIFTSGATESNNLAILGLAEYGEKTGKKHLITSQIEHKAVLGPMEELQKRGFEVTFLPPNQVGWVESDQLQKALREDTLLVSIMHANNETGIIQPLDEYARILAEHPAFFHTDAAQGFGKEIKLLPDKRIDMISISGHKIYAPKGVGALILRRSARRSVPLKPLFYGGGQERGLRPGTLATPLIAGLGEAARLAQAEFEARHQAVLNNRKAILEQIAYLKPELIGDQTRVLPNIICAALPDYDSEAAILMLKDQMAISNGSACSSSNPRPSHVLAGMNLIQDIIHKVIRISY